LCAADIALAGKAHRLKPVPPKQKRQQGRWRNRHNAKYYLRKTIREERIFVKKKIAS